MRYASHVTLRIVIPDVDKTLNIDLTNLMVLVCTDRSEERDRGGTSSLDFVICQPQRKIFNAYNFARAVHIEDKLIKW